LPPLLKYIEPNGATHPINGNTFSLLTSFRHHHSSKERKDSKERKPAYRKRSRSDDRRHHRDYKKTDRKDDYRKKKDSKVKKGRGFLRMDHSSAMRGWEEDDYGRNLKKLKDEAGRLQSWNTKPKEAAPVIVEPTRVEMKADSPASSVERMRRRANSSNPYYV
jgi:hypothetical protein